MYNPTDAQLKAIGEIICMKAQAIFDECQAPDDFCIQHISELDTVIFGGVNRLIWKPEKGFYPDPPYCTKRFLNKYQATQYYTRKE